MCLTFVRKVISQAIDSVLPSRVASIVLLAFLTCFTACWAAETGAKGTGQPPPPSKPATGKSGTAPKGVRAERDIQYVPGGDNAQRLDLYLPEQAADKPLPLVVWIHGGAWKGGDKSGCPALN